jgi:hypothetical protein
VTEKEMVSSMNWTEAVKTGFETVKMIAKWGGVIAALVLALLLARSCSGERDAQARLERAQEAHEIDKADLVRVHEADRSKLEEELEVAKAENADFAAALAKATKEFDARPILVARASTGPVPVEPLKPDPFHVEPSPRPDGCRLWPGDQGEIKVTQAVVETRKGNRVLVGAAEALRVSPEPSLRLFGGEFSTPVTMALGEPVDLQRKKGWIVMAGPVALATEGQGRFGGGLGVVSPPFVFDHIAVAALGAASSGFGELFLGLAWRQ